MQYQHNASKYAIIKEHMNQRQSKQTQKLLPAPKQNYLRAFLTIVGILTFVAVSVFLFLIYHTREVAHDAIIMTEKASVQGDEIPPFPIGVDPTHKIITENPAVDTYLESHTPTHTLSVSSQRSWFGRTIAKLAQLNWYQNLASPMGRILVIEPGERKEEIARNFGNILGWSKDEKEEFLSNVIEVSPEMTEGKFYPSTYVVARGATPAEVTPLITGRFQSEVMARYGKDLESQVPLKNTLTIASLLEREAYDFTDMRLISGVIWNRLFAGMKLQLDATLQYAKADQEAAAWWPLVLPADKDITSPFNTYKHMGLPPAPIANPSLDTILAALNPRKTDCMYYFHDQHSQFHCSVTYKEHVALLKQYYGRGR